MYHLSSRQEEVAIMHIRYLNYDNNYKWYGKYSLDIQVNYDKISLINEITIDLYSTSIISIHLKLIGLLKICKFVL
ncbi:MAG: hypothetical protein HY934_09610 [Candidatus Firestonebacteria bacterium]|nr:hypothetical protein [Candidatus Firestonebacteria bacterium]